ncbi:MAG: tetratricopeptide repeat protein [Bacteroidota bacterium]|nr:tetratricopeptide repeat protein [Bacteroidota bacterium]
MNKPAKAIAKKLFSLFARLNYCAELIPRAKAKDLACLVIISFLFILTACTNKDDASPYDEILAQPLYASLTDSIKQQPKNDELYFRRAVLLNKNNFPEPALADFQKAWSLHKYEKYAFGIANIWLDKKPDSAAIFLNEALKGLPESYLLRLSLARAYDALNKTGEALKVCNQLAGMQPARPEVLLLQSELLDKKGDSLGSIAPMEKAYSLSPASLEVGLKLAYKYAESKNEKVIPLCDSLIRKDSLHLHADPFYVKGVYYSNINDKEKAIQWFDETIRYSYNYLNAYIEKGKILVGQKKIAEALTVFKLANRISPAFPDAYYWIGVCQEKQGQKDEARLSYEKAYSLDKTFTEAKDAADKISK